MRLSSRKKRFVREHYTAVSRMPGSFGGFSTAAIRWSAQRADSDTTASDEAESFSSSAKIRTRATGLSRAAEFPRAMQALRNNPGHLARRMARAKESLGGQSRSFMRWCFERSRASLEGLDAGPRRAAIPRANVLANIAA